MYVLLAMDTDCVIDSCQNGHVECGTRSLFCDDTHPPDLTRCARRKYRIAHFASSAGTCFLLRLVLNASLSVLVDEILPKVSVQ